GIAAAAAIVSFFLGHSKAGVIIIGLVFVGMVLLFAFSRLAVAQNPSINFAGVILVWSVLLFFVVFLTFTVTAFAALWPPPWVDFLGIRHDDDYRPDNKIGRELAGKTVLDILVHEGVVWVLTEQTVQ